MYNSKKIRQSYIDYLINEQYTSYILKYYKNKFGNYYMISLFCLIFILFIMYQDYRKEAEKYYYGNIFSYALHEHKNNYYGAQYVRYIKNNYPRVCSIQLKSSSDHNITITEIRKFNESAINYIHLLNDETLCEITTSEKYNDVVSNLNFYNGTFLIILSLTLIYLMFETTIKFNFIKKLFEEKFIVKRKITDISIDLIDEIIKSSEHIKKMIYENNNVIIQTGDEPEHSV